MAGYTRQSIADIIPGEDVRAEPLNAEFNRLQLAFGTVGHTHDGTAGNAPRIDLSNSVIGVLAAINGGVGGKNNTTAVTNPTVNDDSTQGYVPGSVWVNTATNSPYINVNAQSGAAVWRLIQSPTGSFLQPGNNLSDVTNVATSRQNLGLGIGSNIQAYSAKLDSLAGYSVENTVPYISTGGNYTTFTLTAFSRGLMANTAASNWKQSLGLENVDNTSDATKRISPAFSGTPTAPTATLGTNTTQLATTAFVQSALGAISIPPILPITIISPANNSTGIGSSGNSTFTAQAFSGDMTGFYSNYGIPVANRFVRVFEPGSSTLVQQFTGTGGGNSLTVQLTGSSIATSHTYEWLFGYTDTQGNVTLSPRITATTASQFKPTVGQAYQGGFLAFENFGDGGLSDLVVASKSTETSKTWYVTGTDLSLYSRMNGRSNTDRFKVQSNNMMYAAPYADSVSIGGVAGYLGAIDQLRCIAFNLAPNKAVEAAFKAGGSEVFKTSNSVANYYWSSTEENASQARISYGDGTADPGGGDKTSALTVRAIKSVAVTPPIAIGTYVAAQGGWLAAYFTDFSGASPVTYGLFVSDKAVEVTRAYDDTTSQANAGRQQRTNGSNITENFSGTGTVTYPAMGYCRTLVHGGKDDWYLGAIDEILAVGRMNSQLPSAQQLGPSNTFYWSSTELDASNARGANIATNTTSEVASTAKTLNGFVRPIRRVPLSQLT